MCNLFVNCLTLEVTTGPNSKKVVNYYDLSVLSMSVMGFQKEEVWMGMGGWGELHPSLF